MWESVRFILISSHIYAQRRSLITDIKVLGFVLGDWTRPFRLWGGKTAMSYQSDSDKG